MAERDAGVGDCDLRLRGVLGHVAAAAECLARLDCRGVASLPVAEKALDLVFQKRPLDVARHGNDHVFGAEETLILLAYLRGGQAPEAFDGAAAVLAQRMRPGAAAQFNHHLLAWL